MIKIYPKKLNKNNNLRYINGGEGEIRTPDRVAPMPHFECGAFDHSATSPWDPIMKIQDMIGCADSMGCRL